MAPRPRHARVLSWLFLSAGLGLVAECWHAPLTGQPPAPTAAAWKLDEALEQLALHPGDAYLQYVALQLARRDNRLPEVSDRVAQLARTGPGRPADLFSTFTGALAVQESLQLDTMTGRPPRRPGPPRIDLRAGGQAPAPPPEPARVAVASLTGPTVQSHPWAKMLGGRTPDVGPLAKCVPEDFYLVEFRTFAKLLEAASLGDLWGDHIFTQALGQARSQDTIQRVKRQLGLAEAKSGPLDALALEAVGVTGSDLYLADGSDVTVLLRARRPDLLRSYLDGLTTRAEQAAQGAKRTTGDYLGVPFTHVTTPDRELHVYFAEPQPGLFIRSNSEPAFRRVLEAALNKSADGKPVRRLGDSPEFAYVRTLLPRGAAEEDGLIYLSDPFIRRLVGPQVKLVQRRRLIAYNHLRMIGHAALLFRTEHGRPPKSLQELAEARCAPGVFGSGELVAPGGGEYGLTPDGMAGTHSVYGRAYELTPCLELPLAEVSATEAGEYRAFVQEYNQYWRTYFDPIAVRVQVSPQRYRLETLVLPLIDNSVYTTLAQTLGGPTVPLEPLPVARRTIASFAVHLNKQPLLEMLGPDAEVQAPAPEPWRAKPLLQSVNDLKQIGLALHNYHDANGHFPPAALKTRDGKPGLSWRVAILPFIEQEPLYKEFHLDEPWDSEHNKKLIARMPPLYRGPNAKLAAEGKTNYLVPVGRDTIFPPGSDGTRIAEITDGTSNTIMAVEAADERAAVWTKPDDLFVNLQKPAQGLVRPGQQGFLALMGDGNVRQYRTSADAKRLAALFTRAGNEPDLPTDAEEIRMEGGPADLLGLISAGKLDPKIVRRFLRDGLGDQIAVHLHDGQRPFDIDWSGAFGMADAFSLGGGPNGRNDPTAAIGLVAQVLTGPTSVAIPVKDAKAVDEFLDAFDRFVAESPVHERRGGPGLGIESDFYRTPLPAPHQIRCFVLKGFGLKVRVFWGRIGNGLYLANRPGVLEDIAATADAPTADGQPRGHAMIRLRPENWKEVRPGYDLGWAENNREACRANQALLADVARGWNDRAGAAGPELFDRAARLSGARPFCPDLGRYTLTADGRTCTCSVHGGALDPRQPTAPAEASATGRLLKSFAGLTATLAFEEDGLRAVVTVERK